MLHTMVELLEIRDAFLKLQDIISAITGNNESYTLDSIFGKLDKAEGLLEYLSPLYKEKGEEAFDAVLDSDATNEEKAKRMLMIS